ncbi:YheC/YheD family protein [Brevibacillus nitrificans]|uniref:YheC/YheD family endospore coat-associated protein n=1 Tax=Brevibacillus nitrificans TaxID=651560 RepID=UPI0028559378|nr:YheC/YheD family protein [Brevibacillus nitrificans]MDR7314781.1 glutathione synthase/RimK-type ligase-like ATP-grasp enzyme [Brevibacillus nitrificans]
MSYVPTIVQAYEPKSEVDLYLPQAHMRKWNLSSPTLTVQFGSKQVRARVSSMDRTSLTLIRPSIAQALHLPTGVPLLARYQANQQSLVFGPYVGVLVSTYNAQFPQSPFGPLTPFFNEVADICRKRGGVICAFRLQDVNWDAGIVRGLTRVGSVWRQRVLPLPQCIYNRLVSRQRERSELMTNWVQRCKDANIPFFNEQFLNKWHVHSALETQEAAADHLPSMVRYQSLEDVKNMLSAHRVVYAKPANGSMGRGIIRLRRTDQGYQLAKPGGLVKTFSSTQGLNQYLSKQTKGKPYLLQQGLPLIGIQNRPTDFRVLVQKDRKGEWAVTSMVARLGQNRIVSNISRGGSMLPPQQALRLCGPWVSGNRPTPQTLRAVALKLSVLLEEALPGNYAEFGVDLGVDVRGHVWLLEVNSKPSKTANTVPLPEGEEEPPRRARPSVVRMLEYAAYVSGFPRAAKPKPKPAAKKIRRR